MSSIYMYHCRGALRLHEVRDPVDYLSSDGFNIEFACHVTQCDMLRISTAMYGSFARKGMSNTHQHKHTPCATIACIRLSARSPCINDAFEAGAQGT